MTGPPTEQSAGPSKEPLRHTFVIDDEDDEPVETVDPTDTSRSKRDHCHELEESDNDIELLPGPPKAVCFREPDVVFLPDLSTVRPVKKRFIIRRVPRNGSFPHLSRPLHRRLPVTISRHVGQPIQVPTLPVQPTLPVHLPTPSPSGGSSSSVEPLFGDVTPYSETLVGSPASSESSLFVSLSTTKRSPLRNPYAPLIPPNPTHDLTSDIRSCPGPSTMPTPPKTPNVEEDPALGHTPPIKFIVADSSPGRGKGLILTQPVKRGELIIAEAPLGVFDYPLYSLEIHEVMATRTRRQKDVFNAFGTSYGEKDRMVDIVETNAIPLASQDDEDVEEDETSSQITSSQCAMFENISRVNHSCAPNALWIWKPKEGKQGVMHLRAWKDLPAGEELLCCYDEKLSLEPLRTRKDGLREKFNFSCGCAFCTLPSEAQVKSDRRLQLLQTVAKRWDAKDPLLFARDNRKIAIAWLNQMIGVIEQEERWAFLEPVLADLFEVYVWWGLQAEAKATAQRLKDIWEILSPDSVANSDVERFAKDPKAAEDWAFLLRGSKTTKVTKTKIKVVSQTTTTMATLTA